MNAKKINNFQPELEWESFDWPIEISHLESLNKNYKLPNDAIITIFRNDEYDLEGTITGITKNQEDLDYQLDGGKPKAGQLIKGDSITGQDSLRNKEYRLKHFFLRSLNFNFSGMPPNVKFHFNSRVSVGTLEETFFHDKRKVSYILEFHLTGRINQLFPRTTDRSKEEKFSKSRHGIDPKIENPNLISSRSQGGARDYFYIKTSEFDFIVQRIDKRFLPKWANGVQIEYRNNFKKIPDQETRKAIAEIIGFVLGTQLLKIGESHLDSSFNVVKKHSNNPWGDNVVSKCESSALPPISFMDHHDWNKVERVFNKLVPKYLLYRKEFGLSDVIWKYWISKELAIGTNLPILSSALESLAENYIKSKSLIKTYSKTEKKEYKNLVKNEVELLTKKLSLYDFSNRVIDKVQYPFNLGVGEKMNVFFENISIHFDNKSIENEALKARNKMTHSSIEDSDEEIKKYTKLTRAYQTLVNRTILTVLDFDETYIDYYSIGHPQKNLNENI